MLEQFKEKFVSPEVAAKAVRSGDWVDYGFGGGFPELMDRAGPGAVLLLLLQLAHRGL